MNKINFNLSDIESIKWEWHWCIENLAYIEFFKTINKEDIEDFNKRYWEYYDKLTNLLKEECDNHIHIYYVEHKISKRYITIKMEIMIEPDDFNKLYEKYVKEEKEDVR